MSFKYRDLTGILDVTADEIRYILTKARDIKDALQNRDVTRYRLAADMDLLAALLFYENSTRTRTSFEIAALRLGMHVTGFSGAEGTSVQKGESLRHTLDMYEAYQCDCVIMRHPLDGSARFAARHLGIPVFNAGDGKHEHPTQTLLDLFTIQEHLGRLEDFDIGISGDLKFGRTAHSLLFALTKFPHVRIHLFSHPALAMPEPLVEFALAHGLSIQVWDNFEDMVPHLDILYQTRVQKERMPDLSEYRQATALGMFSPSLMQRTKTHFGLMHPLPVDKASPSVDIAIDRHPKILYRTQAGNGVPTRMAELALALGLLGNDFEGECWSDDEREEDFIENRPISTGPVRHDVSIRPIRGNGVVIDHMAPYAEETLVRALRVRERKDIYRAATVKSVRTPSRVKGMLMIEDRVLSDHDLHIIAALSPGCTVNIIENGSVKRKMRLHLPARVSGVPGMRCTNPGCISRPEYLESVDPLMVRVDADKLRCDYCGQIMRSTDIV